MMPAHFVLVLLLGVEHAGAAARRKLSLSDVAYDLAEFGTTYRTRAHHLFESAQHFAERLLAHETALADGTVQTFLVNLQPGFEPSDELKASLEDRSALVLDTVVGNDLLVHGPPDGVGALRDLPEVRRVVALLPELKISPHFAELLPKNATSVRLTLQLIPYDRHSHLRLPAALIAEQLSKELARACVAGGALARLASCAAAQPLVVHAESERVIGVRGIMRPDADAVAGVVARRAEVLWVEPVPQFFMLNEDSALLVQSGSTPGPTGTAAVTLVGTTPVWDMGIHGEGEIIGVADSGLDTGHCFFEQAAGQTAGEQTYSQNSRKVVAYRAYADGGATGTADHGTHVTGSILGESSVANAQGAGEKGVAYKAKVSFTDIGEGNSPGLDVPNDLANNMFNVDRDNGAHIHSNSWGANINAYTTYSSQVDAFSFDNDDFVILFAAGNSGADGPGSVGAPATAKNCITVGASQTPNSGQGRTDGNMASFSSQGPTSDGRTKPDVSAPGFFVSSANSNSAGDCPITIMAGTSMATPVTAGAVALVRQFFREGYYPTGEKGGTGGIIPTGALMKAMIVNSAVEMTGGYRGAQAPLTPVPSNIQGYGRIQLNRIISDSSGARAPGDRLFIVDDVTKPITASGDVHEFDVPVGGPDDPVLGRQFKVTLVWTDPPGQPFAASPLVNNLNLEVEANGVTLLGNDYTGTGVADALNNVEQVVLQAGLQATYKVRVKGQTVRQGSQPYALVVTGPLQARGLRLWSWQRA